MPAKKTTAKKTTAKEKKEQPKTPQQLLEMLIESTSMINQSINQLVAYTESQQNQVFKMVESVANNIKEQTTILNDFSAEMRSMRMKTAVWENLSEVLFQMQNYKIDMDKEIMAYRKETRATAKALIHTLDQFRNQLIDLQHIWKID